TTGGEHMLMFADFFEGHGAAKAGNVFVVTVGISPFVIQRSNTLDIFLGELFAGAIDHRTEIARVDEEHLSATVSVSRAATTVFGKEPKTSGNLCRIEKLTRKRDNAIDRVAFH